MNLEDQVCSLELAERLKELGVEQESIFWWINPEYTINNCHELMYREDTYIKEFWPKEDFYFSAFTAEELGKMLPNIIEYNAPHLSEMYSQFRINTTKFISIGKDCEPCNNFLINYHLCFGVNNTDGEVVLDTSTAFKNIYDPKLADAYAKMLIKLIEEGLVSP